MKPITIKRRVRIMREKGVENEHVGQVCESVRILAKIGNATNRIRPALLGHSDMTERHIEEARSASKHPEQLDARWLIGKLEQLHANGNRDFGVIIVKSDINGGNIGFVVGGAKESIGAVISTYRFLHLPRKLQLECILTESLHEIGHVFGLVPRGRKENVQEMLGWHCTNRCVMRQGMDVPDDWIRMTEDRLRHGPFCEQCIANLRRYFQQ